MLSVARWKKQRGLWQFANRTPFAVERESRSFRPYGRSFLRHTSSEINRIYCSAQ